MISVVICTHNRGRVFEETVRSFLECHTDGIDHELVLVDNNSIDGTREIGEQFAASNSRIRYVMEPQVGLSHARNKGIRVSVGDIVAFVDDDVYFSPFWLMALDSAFKRRADIACIGGKVVLHFEADRPSWIEDYILWVYGVTRYGDNEREILPPETPIGCNMAFRRSLFQQIGVFNTSLGRRPGSLLSGEETHVINLIVNAGLKTLYSPEALVSHRILPDRLTRQWVLSRSYWEGVTEVALKQLSDEPLSRRMLAWRVVRKILGLVRRWRYAAGLLCARFGMDVEIPVRKQIEIYSILGYLRQTVAEALAFHGRKRGEGGRRTGTEGNFPGQKPGTDFSGGIAIARRNEEMKPDLPVVREIIRKGLAAGRKFGKSAYRELGLDFCFPPKEPNFFDMELSNRCNLKCKMCWFHGDRGIGDRYANQELTSQEVFHFVDQIAKYNPYIYIGGTEPFMRSDFLPILRHIKSHGMPVSFTTNGLLLNDDAAEELVSIGVDSIHFSIDGNEEIHDRERGEGAFGKATSVIRKISEIKKRETSTKPIVKVNMTVTNHLINGIGKAIHSIRNSTNDGIDSLVIHHFRYLTPNELSKHRSRVRRSLGCIAPGAASHLVPDFQISDPTALADEIIGFRGQPKISMFPDLEYMDLVHYYSEGAYSKKRCTAPLRGVVIKPNGDVLFCPDEWIDDYVLGNIREQDIAEIWNSEKARKFRSALYRERQFPACKRCSWMYTFG